MTTYNTGNPVPSADARDRYDNSQTLDEVVNGDSASYTTRTGKQVISLGGMNSRFNNAQEARESEFNLSQEEKQEAFQSFLEGTGWSSLGAYGAGVVITSHTQTVDYLGQPYSLKPSIPASLDTPYVATGIWATEGVNFKLVGDNSLRQDLSGAAGAALLGYGTSTVAKELDKTFKDATAFFASARPFVAGDRVSTRSGEAWDIVAAGAGEQNHPVTGMGVIAVAKANAFMVARSYDVHRSNSGARNYAGIQLALDKLGNRDAGALELPYANEFSAIQVAGNIAVPENVKLSGSSWRTCCLVFTTANGGITFGSSSIIEDMDLRGGQVASIGITERGEFNRASISRVRIQDFTQWNLAIGMHGAANNSLFTDIQMKFANEANLAIGQSLNNTFFQTNGDLSSTAPATARGIRVYDLFPGSTDGNKQCRNTKFVKGIYERGLSTYQLEVERAVGLSFDGTEFNNGSIATCQIKKGSVQMYSPFFSLNGTNDILHADNASDVRIYTPIFSGSSGRALSEMLEGPVQVDGSLAYPTTARNLRWLPLTPSGNATSDTSPAIGTRATSATGTATNRVSSGSTSGATTAGQSRIWEATVSVSAIASGVVKVYLQVTTSPFRILMGTLAVGVNRFSVPTSLPSLGALDFIGDGAFDITFLTAKTESF